MTTQAKFLKHALSSIGASPDYGKSLRVRTRFTTFTENGKRYREYGPAFAFVKRLTQEQKDTLRSLSSYIKVCDIDEKTSHVVY